MRITGWSAILLLAGASACAAPETANQSANGADAATANGAGQPAGNSQGSASRAVAALQDAQGAAAGSATATGAANGITLALQVEGLPAGQHGVHVHMTGRCDAPTFETAGGHWNPANAQHGLEEPAGQHAGDMPNLNVDQSGLGTLEYTLQGGSFEDLLDGDGAAFVVHASADDQRTDPSGNSGGRIACGVFRAS